MLKWLMNITINWVHQDNQHNKLLLLYKQCPVLNPWYLLYLKQTANQYEDWGGPYFTQYQICDFGGRDWGKHPK